MELNSVKEEWLQFVPISGFKGDNLTSKSANLSWWKGGTLLDILQNLKEPKRPSNLPLRIPIQSTYFKKGPGVIVPSGRVATGTLKSSQKVVFAPSNQEAVLKSIQMYSDGLNEAFPGNNIAMNLIEKVDVDVGHICGDPENDPPFECENFTAEMSILNVTGNIKAGYRPTFCCHTSSAACKFVKILERTDPKTNKVIKNPDWIKKGDRAVVVVEPVTPFVIEPFHKYPQLGCFAVRNDKQTVAVGIVRSVQKKEQKK